MLNSNGSTILLGELLAEDRGISVGVMYPGNHDTAGVPLIRSGDLANDRVNPAPDFRISPKVHAEYRRTELIGGELLMSLVGNVGRCALVSPQMLGWNAARAIAVMRFKNVDDAAFVRLALMSPTVRHLIDVWSNTTVQKTLNLKEIKRLPLPWPTASDRKLIVSTMSAIDAKIGLNRSMNETLGALAWVIFKDCFIDFGPTRAKMAGHSAYLAPDLWNLIPDQLDGEEKPLGWSRRPLDQISDFLNGLALQKFPPTGSDYLPVIKISQLRAGVAGDGDRASTDIPTRYIVDDGDVLFSWSGSLLHRVWTGGRGALNQHLFKVTSERFPKWLFFYWIAFHMEWFRATAASKATTMGHIQRHHLAQAMTVIPDEEVLKAAHEIINPLFERQQANELEARTLARMRDLLLPKLMSGEVAIKDAEKFAEMAA